MMRQLRFLLLRLRLWYERRRGLYDLQSDEEPPARSSDHA
jgi:hypothetical protein